MLIHDAARPFIDAATIQRTIDALDRGDGALVAVPVVDTLKRAGSDGASAGTVDRAGLWRAQTPQGFRYAAILAAHRAQAGGRLTDDAAVAEQAGIAITLVHGSEDNFKVTTEDDLMRAERLLAAGGVFRTGMGFDVHAFGPGDHVWLCGVRMPFGRGLVGHSDADVGAPCADRRIPRRARRRRYRQPFPRQRPAMEGRVVGPLPRPCRRPRRARGAAPSSMSTSR